MSARSVKSAIPAVPEAASTVVPEGDVVPLRAEKRRIAPAAAAEEALGYWRRYYEE